MRLRIGVGFEAEALVAVAGPGRRVPAVDVRAAARVLMIVGVLAVGVPVELA